MGRYALRLPDSTKKAAERLAGQDGVSLNQFIAMAVAEKVAAIETAEEFFRRRAARSSGRGRELLDRAGTEPPRPGDEA